jgi:uncharacterized protein (DUF1778 family)
VIDAVDLCAPQAHIITMSRTMVHSPRNIPPSVARTERLVARVSAEQKQLFRRAAELQGRSLSDFLIASAQEAAHRAVREHDVIALGARDSAAFVAGLLEPPPINDRLRETLRRHARLTRPAGGG